MNYIVVDLGKDYRIASRIARRDPSGTHRVIGAPEGRALMSVLE